MIRTEERTFVGPSPSRGHRRLPGDQLRLQLRFNAAPSGPFVQTQPGQHDRVEGRCSRRDRLSVIANLSRRAVSQGDALSLTAAWDPSQNLEMVVSESNIDATLCNF